MILNRQTKARLPLGNLHRFAQKAQRELSVRRDFTVCLLDDRAIRGLNARFLGRRRATDVLSFPGGDGARGFLGDIAISVEAAKKNAQREGHSLVEEIKLLILHGLLHLLGYDHEKDQGQMTRKELRLRRSLGLAS
jgi:probable rRNA maturation factor